MTRRQLLRWFEGIGLALVTVLGLAPLASAAGPSWWVTRGVVNTNLTANDYAAVNQGQVKNVASNAWAEMNANLPGGAGSNVLALINSFSRTNNYQTVNVGQLKYVAKPFYDRLIAVGYTNAYPWSGSTTPNDYAIANIGQLKNLFAWDITKDSDGDGIPDWWELANGSDPNTNDAQQVSTNAWAHGLTNLQVYENPSVLISNNYSTLGDGIADWWKVKYGFSLIDPTVAAADPDGDGLSNLQEYLAGTSAFSSDTDGDGIPDGWELAHGLNPLDYSDASADYSGDGLSNLQKYSLGLDPWKYYASLDIVVNSGRPYTASLAISIQPVSTNYPNIRVGLEDPSMSNATVLANSGGPISYTLPDNGDGLYHLFLQYADAQGNAASTPLVKIVTLDRLAPVVGITSPASNTVLDQAFITLQAVAADPDPTTPTPVRPLAIWVNDQRFWDRAGTNIVIQRFPVPSGTNSFTVTIRAADQAGHTGEVSRTWTVDTSGDTVAPQLSSFNIATNSLLPDVSTVWVEGAVDDSNALVTAVVSSDSGDVTTNSMNVRGLRFEGLVPLESGTNQVVFTASDAAGNSSSNLFTMVRSTRYRFEITSPAFGEFATAPSNYVSGYVSALFDEGLPTQTNVTSVFINGVAAVLDTNVDANGNLSFTTTNAIPLGVPITGFIAGPGIPTDPPPDPPAQTKEYEVTHRETWDENIPGTEGFWNLHREDSVCWPDYLHRYVWSMTQDELDGDPDTVQEVDCDRWDSPPACVTELNPDRIAWQLGTPDTGSLTFPGPLDRSLSFGTDYTHGQGNGGDSVLVEVPGPCCCVVIGSDFVDCSLPDQSGNNLCHGRPRGVCPITGEPGDVGWCLVKDHYELEPYEAAVLTRYNRDAGLRFIAPRQYGTNTTVIFTFEGVDYRRPGGISPDLSQVKFRGQDPIAYSNEAQSVSYLLTVDGGREYMLCPDDFEWPAFSDPETVNYTDTDTNCYALVRSSFLVGSYAEDMHWLSWTDFHNAKPGIVGPDNLYVFCNPGGRDMSAIFTAGANPAVVSSVSWSIEEGSEKVHVVSTQGTAAIIEPTDAAHASTTPDDVTIRADVTFVNNQPKTLTKRVTVRKVWVIIPGKPVLTPPETLPPGMPLEAYIPYTLIDRLCAPMPPSRLAGLPVTESFPNGTPCAMITGDDTVSTSGTFHDHVTLSSECVITSYQQTIGCDCATLTQTVSSDSGAQTVTSSRTGGNTCQ